MAHCRCASVCPHEQQRNHRIQYNPAFRVGAKSIDDDRITFCLSFDGFMHLMCYSPCDVAWIYSTLLSLLLFLTSVLACCLMLTGVE